MLDDLARGLVSHKRILFQTEADETEDESDVDSKRKQQVLAESSAALFHISPNTDLDLLPHDFQEFNTFLRQLKARDKILTKLE